MMEQRPAKKYKQTDRISSEEWHWHARLSRTYVGRRVAKRFFDDASGQMALFGGEVVGYDM